MKAIRRILHSSHTFVRSVEAYKSASAITLDHLIDDQIRMLKSKEVRVLSSPSGDRRGAKASRYDEIVQLEEGLNKAIQAIEAAGDDEGALSELGVLPVEKNLDDDLTALE